MNIIIMTITLIMGSMNNNISFMNDMGNKVNSINYRNASNICKMQNDFIDDFIDDAYRYYYDNYGYTGEESQEYIIDIYLDSID